MKITPSKLFTTATVIILLCGIVTAKKTLDIQLHDSYFIISYMHVAILISTFTGLTTLVYIGLERLKRPIKSLTGIWHFGLFVTGLLLISVASIIPAQINSYDTNNPYANYFNTWTAFLIIGLFLLVLSFVVFIYGLTKSLLSNMQH